MLISKIFKRDKPLERVGQIIGWWEWRRILFNIVVGLIGILNCVLMVVILLNDTAATLRPAPGPLFFTLPVYVMIIFVYGVMANICYTSGWIVEIIALKVWKVKTQRFGEILFIAGLVFSIILTLTPAGLFLGIVIFADNGYVLERPDEKDIVGVYFMEGSETYSEPPSFVFRSDGTFAMNNIRDSMQIHRDFGSGRWELVKDGNWWKIELYFEEPVGDKARVHLCGRKSPYKIELSTWEDPDAPNYVYFIWKYKK
ncbi:MAG: hypothetical protein AB1599_05050 [Planctomycetota bacterium]